MLERKKVLLVDDEVDLVEALTLRLRAGGEFDVRTATDGASGLALAAAWLPDVIVLDVSMSGIDGWEFCRRVRRGPRTARIAIIIATAWLSADLEAQVRDADVQGILLKPFKDGELEGAISELAAAI